MKIVYYSSFDGEYEFVFDDSFTHSDILTAIEDLIGEPREASDDLFYRVVEK